MAELAPDVLSSCGTRARQRAEARSRLLRAAKEVFEEKGFLEVRVADIAGRAGVSHGLFYHYFDSKQDVFRELAAAIDQQLTDTMDVVLDQSSATTPGERLRQAIGQHFERFRSEARMMGLIEEVSRYDETVKSARDAWQRVENERLIDAIRQLQKQGLADRGLDPTARGRCHRIDDVGIRRTLAGARRVGLRLRRRRRPDHDDADECAEGRRRLAHTGSRARAR